MNKNANNKKHSRVESCVEKNKDNKTEGGVTEMWKYKIGWGGGSLERQVDGTRF